MKTIKKEIRTVISSILFLILCLAVVPTFSAVLLPSIAVQNGWTARSVIEQLPETLANRDELNQIRAVDAKLEKQSSAIEGRLRYFDVAPKVCEQWYIQNIATESAYETGLSFVDFESAASA